MFLHQNNVKKVFITFNLKKKKLFLINSISDNLTKKLNSSKKEE